MSPLPPINAFLLTLDLLFNLHHHASQTEKEKLLLLQHRIITHISTSLSIFVHFSRGFGVLVLVVSNICSKLFENSEAIIFLL